MKQLKLISFILVVLVLGVSWGLAGWSLGLENYDAPEMLIFLGRFHPLVLHIPIGLMALAVLLDVAAVGPQKWRGAVPKSTWLYFLISLSAGVAVIHGILLYASGGYEGSELAERHLWGGCAFLTIVVLTFILKVLLAGKVGEALIGLIMTGLGMLVLSISAHDGASLTHGESYLSQYAPEPLKPILEPGYEPKEVAPAVASVADGNVYEVAVQPIFERVCVQCHKESKSKGKLRMDTYAELMKGGAGGSIIEPGDVEDSYMIELMELPADDDDRMPPEGKPQHTDAELAILKWWISIGAPGEGSLSSHAPPAEILHAVEGLSAE